MGVSEPAQHREITLTTEMDIYFCDPYAPWQRGSNENTVSIEDGSIGLISQAGAGSSR